MFSSRWRFTALHSQVSRRICFLSPKCSPGASPCQNLTHCERGCLSLFCACGLTGWGQVCSFNLRFSGTLFNAHVRLLPLLWELRAQVCLLAFHKHLMHSSHPLSISGCCSTQGDCFNNHPLFYSVLLLRMGAAVNPATASHQTWLLPYPRCGGILFLSTGQQTFLMLSVSKNGFFIIIHLSPSQRPELIFAPSCQFVFNVTLHMLLTS